MNNIDLFNDNIASSNRLIAEYMKFKPKENEGFDLCLRHLNIELEKFNVMLALVVNSLRHSEAQDESK